MPIVEFWLALAATMLLVVGFGLCLILDKRRSLWVDRRFPGTGRTKVLYGDYGAAGRTEHRMYTTERLYRSFRARKWPIGGAMMHLIPCVIATAPKMIEYVLSDEFIKVRCGLPGSRVFTSSWNAFEDDHFGDLLKMATEESRAVADALCSTDDEVVEDVKAITELFVVRILARSIFGKRWNEQRKLPLPSVGEMRPPNVIGSVVASMFPNSEIHQGFNTFFHTDSPALLEELVHSLAGECTNKHNFLDYLQNTESWSSTTDQLPLGDARKILQELLQNVFFFASGTLIAALYELAQNPELQEQLHQALKRSGDTMVDDLDKVIGETLRKYPPVEEISFLSVVNTRLPGCDLMVPHNTRVIVPVYAIHRDAEYYPDPARFDPSRPTFRSNDTAFPSCLYRPLGDKPHPVGASFAMMLVRVGMTHILARCRVRLTPESPTFLEMCPNQAIPYPRGKVVLLMRRAID